MMTRWSPDEFFGRDPFLGFWQVLDDIERYPDTTSREATVAIETITAYRAEDGTIHATMEAAKASEHDAIASVLAGLSTGQWLALMTQTTSISAAHRKVRRCILEAARIIKELPRGEGDDTVEGADGAS